MHAFLASGIDLMEDYSLTFFLLILFQLDGCDDRQLVDEIILNIEDLDVGRSLMGIPRIGD